MNNISVIENVKDNKNDITRNASLNMLSCKFTAFELCPLKGQTLNSSGGCWELWVGDQYWSTASVPLGGIGATLFEKFGLFT